MIHRITALIVALAIVILLWRLWQQSHRDRGIRSIAWIIIGLFVLQLSLGMVNIWYALPVWSRVLHLGTAASIWGAMVILTVTILHGRYQYTRSRHLVDGTGR